MQPSTPPSQSKLPTSMPSSVPTISTRPTGYWDRPHLQQSLPSESPSIQPTSSLNPSLEPSIPPSKSNQPSDTPSGVPSLSDPPTDQPSSIQSIANPTSPPTEGLVMSGREFHPCEEGQVALVGATVTLYSVLGQQIDQTVTDSEGRWEFTGLPPGRYFTITDYPECRRVLERGSLGSGDVNLSASLSDEQKIKFFKTGDMCNSKVSLGDWDVFSTADWNEVALFDTLDECCANMFWHDIDGCLSRSRVAFQFEFCVDVSGLDELADCPLSEIHVIENAMQTGLDKSSNLVLTEIGSIVLTNVDGKTKCSQSDYSDEFSSHTQTTTTHAQSPTTVCGTVTTNEAKCREEICLKKTFNSISSKFQSFFDSGEFSFQLDSLARDASESLFPHLRAAKVAENSFVTKKLLLPLTVMSTPHIGGHENEKPLQYAPASTHSPRFHPTFINGQLCHSKISFDSWEASYETLEECCKAHFSWDYEACCRSAGMGGC